VRLLEAPDTRERHLVAARLLAGAATVLDVGGAHGSLAAVLPQARVTTLNLEPPADVVGDALALPFPDDTFDAATSLDVLEHLAPDDRATHLRELARVARRLVVVGCPVGGAVHERAERSLRARFPGHRFLEEHARWGLPSEEELRALAPGAEMLFHGDVERAAVRFRARALARRGHPIAAARAVSDLLAPPDLGLRPTSEGAPNRAFIVLRVGA
jgi:SAM-dependent methyltransferase